MSPYHSLKAAVRDLVTAAGGGVRAAKISRADAPMLSRYGSVHDERFAPIDVIADLEQEVGDPIVTRMLADLAGYELVPKAEAQAHGEDFIQHVADVATTMGAAVGGLAQAQADGRVTPEEAAALVSKFVAAGTQIAETTKDLQRTAEAARPAPVRRVK